MIESTKDILFLTLTVAIVVLTFFLAWFLYYLVSMIRQAHAVMKDVTAGVEKVHGILDSIKETINQSSSPLRLVVTAARELTGLYARRRQKQNEENNTKTKRDKKE